MRKKDPSITKGSRASEWLRFLRRGDDGNGEVSSAQPVSQWEPATASYAAAPTETQAQKPVAGAVSATGNGSRKSRKAFSARSDS